MSENRIPPWRLRETAAEESKQSVTQGILGVVVQHTFFLKALLTHLLSEPLLTGDFFPQEHLPINKCHSNTIVTKHFHLTFFINLQLVNYYWQVFLMTSALAKHTYVTLAYIAQLELVSTQSQKIDTVYKKSLINKHTEISCYNYKQEYKVVYTLSIK